MQHNITIEHLNHRLTTLSDKNTQLETQVKNMVAQFDAANHYTDPSSAGKESSSSPNSHNYSISSDVLSINNTAGGAFTHNLHNAVQKLFRNQSRTILWRFVMRCLTQVFGLFDVDVLE